MAEKKKLAKLVDEIAGLSVLELSELVEALKEKLGVEAVPLAAAPSGQAAAPEADEEKADEGGNKTVMLTEAGANKIAVIKALREINPSLGLKDAKDMTENLPAEVLKDAKADAAKEASDKLTGAGAKVELK